MKTSGFGGPRLTSYLVEKKKQSDIRLALTDGDKEGDTARRPPKKGGEMVCQMVVSPLKKKSATLRLPAVKKKQAFD